MRRVPSGFNWPLGVTWAGYIRPDFLRADPCPDCENGYSPEARVWYEKWYGNAPFSPEETGSTPYTPDTPHIRAAAEHNIASSPQYYGTGEAAIYREASRLARLYNSYWSNHLSQEDVDALYDAGEMIRLTHKFDHDAKEWVDVSGGERLSAAEINIMQFSFLGNPVDHWSALKVKAKQLGFKIECATCNGRGSVEAFVGQRKVEKKWKPVKPPKGDAWQIWETVSEGSPVTPAFDTPEELAKHWAAKNSGNYENALKWIVGDGWAPSGIIIGGEAKTSEDIISEGGL